MQSGLTVNNRRLHDEASSSSQLDPARRALHERLTSARRAGSTSQLVELASSCKRGVSKRARTFGSNSSFRIYNFVIIFEARDFAYFSASNDVQEYYCPPQLNYATSFSCEMYYIIIKLVNFEQSNHFEETIEQNHS